MLPFGVFQLRMHASQLSVCALRLSSCLIGGGFFISGAAAGPATADGQTAESADANGPGWRSGGVESKHLEQQVSGRRQRESGRSQLRGNVTHRAYHGQLSYQRQ
jgi:hypothetical protein